MQVSTKNWKYKLQQDATQVPHYGLRKLSVGVASVLLGLTFYAGTTGVAQADTTSDNMSTSDVTSNVDSQTDRSSQVTLRTSGEASQTSPSSDIVNHPVVQGITDDSDSSSATSNGQELAGDWKGSIIYQNGANSIQANAKGWANITVASPELTNVKKGDVYDITIGSGLPLNFDKTPLTTDNFDVNDLGIGRYQLTAK